MTVYDDQGVAVKLDYYFIKTADNHWIGRPYVGKTPITDTTWFPHRLYSDFYFDKNGDLCPPTRNITIDVPNTNNKDKIFTIWINILDQDPVTNKTRTTQMGSNFTFSQTQDGYAPGTYQSFSFSEKGEILVHYSNNVTKVVGLVGVSTVTAPDRLIPITGTAFQVTPDAGAQTFGHPGEGIFGTLKSGLLEESNADLGNELTDMIEAQRNYTANSKVFQTGSEVLDVILSLKR